MLSKKRIAELQKDLLEIYEIIENDLMTSILKSIDYNEEVLNIKEWKAKQLDNLGAINKRNSKIIAKHAKASEKEVTKLFKDMAFESVENDEVVYKQAIKKGVFKKTVPISDSPGINRIIKKAIKSANKSLNLVNTRALESSKKEFLNIINQAFIEVDQGVYSYQQAVRKAVNKLADKGITGHTYRTKAGKILNYQLDTAVRREVITTSLQSARDCQDERMKEYGADLIEVSSHTGARPKCAIDQGQIYSNSGKNKKYAARSTTSEGDADGLFGINCAHQYSIYIPGITKQTFFPIDQKKNEKIYKQSQYQRYLERQIRKDKRKLITSNAIGDIDKFGTTSVKLKSKEKQLKQFMDRTGRTQQPRTQEPGFNRSVSQKAVHAAKKLTS